MSAKVTQPAPDFTATAVMPDNTFEENYSLADQKGKYVVLFFYPLDFTFVCPSEIIAFDKKLEEFKARNCEVIGGTKNEMHKRRHSLDEHVPTAEYRKGSGPLLGPLGITGRPEGGIIAGRGTSYTTEHPLVDCGRLQSGFRLLRK